MTSPVLNIPQGERLHIRVREDVSMPCTFFEIVDCIMAVSLINNQQWEHLRIFRVL